MVKIRRGKCRNKLKLSKRGRVKLHLPLRYIKVCILIFFRSRICILTFSCLFKQDALEAADFRGYSPRTQESLSCWNPDSIGFNLIEHVLCHIVRNERPGAVLVFMTGWDDINSLKDQLQSHPLLGDPNRVLLLACHGSMPSAEQVLSLFFSLVFNGYSCITLF